MRDVYAPLVFGLALEHFPQRVDVLTNVLPGDGMEIGSDVGRWREAFGDELLQVEAGLAFELPVLAQDLFGRPVGQRVGERLAVGEHGVELHVLEQLPIHISRRGHGFLSRRDRRASQPNTHAGDLENSLNHASQCQPGRRTLQGAGIANHGQGQRYVTDPMNERPNNGRTI